MYDGFLKLCLILTMLALVACGGAEERKAKYLEKGKAYLEQNIHDKALVEFKNVLQIDPKFAQGYAYLGKTYEALGRYRKAFSAYSKAVELAPEDIESLIGIGRIQIWARSPDKAIEYANRVLAMDSQNIEALVVRAGARFQKNAPAEALIDVRSALAIDPDHVGSLAMLSRIYVQQGQRDKAEILINNALQRQPASVSLIKLLTQLYMEAEKYSQASLEIQKLIDMHPGDIAYRMQKISIYRQMGETDRVEQALRGLVTDFPDSLEAKQSIISFLAQARDLMFAQLELSSFLKKDPNNPDLKLISAQLYSASKDYQKAEDIYREIIRKYEAAASSKAQYRLALLMLSTDRVDDARPMLEDLLERYPGHVDALMLRGRIAIADGDADSAISDFRNLLKEQPNSEDAMKYLVQAYQMADQPELAREQLSRLVALQPLDLSFRLELGRLLFGQGHYIDAIEQLRIVSKLEADNFEARDLMFRAYLESGDYAQASGLVDDIKRLKPGQPLGNYYQGLVLQAQQKYDAAIERFGAALEQDAEAIEPLSMLVRTAVISDQPGLAVRELQKVIRQSPQHVVARNLLGEVHANEKQFDKAIAAFEKAIELKPDWWIPYRNLAGTYRLAKQNDKAVASYVRGIEHAQHKPQLVILLARLYEQNGDTDEAITLYEQALQDYPDSIIMANNLALLLVEYRDDQASRDRALDLVKLFDGTRDPSFLDTRGWVYYKYGDYDRALEALQLADQLAPDQLIIHYHLGSVYFSKGDTAQARKYLQTVMDSDANFKWREQVREMMRDIEQQQALNLLPSSS